MTLWRLPAALSVCCNCMTAYNLHADQPLAAEQQQHYKLHYRANTHGVPWNSCCGSGLDSLQVQYMLGVGEQPGALSLCI